MRPVELGVVHEIPIVFSQRPSAAAPSGYGAASPPAGASVGAEDPAPPGEDRLWDASHPLEASYLLASESRGQQSFQIANIDMRVIYRIGLSDEAARQSIYGIADPQALIRAISGQLLARYFARNTLIDILGQNRESFTNAFRTSLQSELDRLASGIEAIAIVVEAIHPPPGAASAYHNVQAAEISAKSRISLERAAAVRKRMAAARTALVNRNAALAGAAELTRQAQGESVLFHGDRDAYSRAGQTFLFERRLDRLRTALARSDFVVIDHRLTGRNMPTIDLRNLGATGIGADELTDPGSAN
jgi:regulator of protease activity HflC (stomatin/prohibitin superfamily)